MLLGEGIMEEGGGVQVRVDEGRGEDTLLIAAVTPEPVKTRACSSVAFTDFLMNALASSLKVCVCMPNNF